MMAGGRGSMGRLGLGLSVVGLMGAGCAQILGADWGSYTGGEGGEGGGGAATSTGTQPAGCVDPETDCPATGTACVVAVCERGGCGQQNVALAPKTPCIMDGGGSGACDGAGVCVECIDGSDCTSGNCAGSQCACSSTTGVPASLPSCQAGHAGAGNNCGSSSDTSCCENKLVPCGTYNRSDDPSYPATVSDFWLDTYEITVGRFRAFVDAGQGTQASPPAPGAGEHPEIPGSGWDVMWSNSNLTANTAAFKSALHCQGTFATWTDSPGTHEKLPINCITWYEAFAFCIWDGGRLPTEAEWNYAAAGGAEQREYPWGSGIDGTYAVYDCTGDGSALGSCAFSDIRPVGSRSPKGDGKRGQADLAGNVWEWTLDWYDNYITSCNDCANVNDAGSRVVRGGSFGSIASLLRAAYRVDVGPASRGPGIGARCARTQ